MVTKDSQELQEETSSETSSETLTLNEQVEIIKDWMKNHPNLPEYIDATHAKRFITACYGDLDATKRLIEHNYKLRNQYSHIFITRDPLSPDVDFCHEVADIGIPMPIVTPDNYKVVISRLIDFDYEKFHFNELIKTFFLSADLRFKLPDNCEGLNKGEIGVFDMKGLSIRHLTKVTISTLRVYMRFTQEAFPIRLRSLHLINVPSHVDHVLRLLRPFMKAEVKKVMFFHLPGSDTISEHFSQKVMPNEYGGVAGTMQDIKKDWIEQMKKNQDYLSNQSNWLMKPKVDDTEEKPSFFSSFRIWS